MTVLVVMGVSVSGKLVKEYFGLTVGQPVKTWSIMETVISVVGLILTALLWLAVRRARPPRSKEGAAPVRKRSEKEGFHP